MGYVTPHPTPRPHICVQLLFEDVRGSSKPTSASCPPSLLFPHCLFVCLLNRDTSVFTCRSAHKLWLLYMIHLNPPSTCFLQISVPPSLRTHSYLPLIYLFFLLPSLQINPLLLFFFFFDFLSCLPACHTVCVCHLLFCCRESNDSECLSRFTFSSVVPLLHSLMSSVLLTNRCTMTALEEDH